MSTSTRSLIDLMEEIAEAIRPIRFEIPDLQVVPLLNWNPTPPSIDIFPAAPFQEGAGFDPTDPSPQLFFIVRARVATGDNEAGQRELLRMLDPRDPASIEAALYETDVVVAEVTEYREYLEDTAENGRLIGAEWRVTTFL